MASFDDVDRVLAGQLIAVLLFIAWFSFNAEWTVRLLPARLDYFGILDDLARATSFGKASAIMGWAQVTGKISGWCVRSVDFGHPFHAWLGTCSSARPRRTRSTSSSSSRAANGPTARSSRTQTDSPGTG
jgi:hypothetical protein